MNDELQKQLVAMLKSLASTANDAAAFAKSQIPPLVQEKILIGRVEETVYFGIAVAVGLTLITLGLIYWRKAWRATMVEGEAFFLLNLAALAAGLFIMTFNMHDFLLVWFAPRLYIVDWLKGMVR